MANTINARVPKYKPLTKNLQLDDKCPRLKPDICFYDVDENDKYDRVYQEEILVKIEKVFPSTSKTPQKLVFPINKSFGHQGPVVFSAIRNMRVSIFEHFGIISWDNIDKMWVYFDKFLKVTELTNFRSACTTARILQRRILAISGPQVNHRMFTQTIYGIYERPMACTTMVI